MDRFLDETNIKQSPRSVQAAAAKLKKLKAKTEQAKEKAEHIKAKVDSLPPEVRNRLQQPNASSMSLHEIKKLQDKMLADVNANAHSPNQINDHEDNILGNELTTGYEHEHEHEYREQYRSTKDDIQESIHEEDEHDHEPTVPYLGDIETGVITSEDYEQYKEELNEISMNSPLNSLSMANPVLTNDNTVDKQVNASPVPKKRGRPRKPIAEESHEPKRRGRPPKQKTPEEIAMEKIPKKRGRPRKVINPEESETKAYQEEIETIMKEDPSTIPDNPQELRVNINMDMKDSVNNDQLVYNVYRKNGKTRLETDGFMSLNDNQSGEINMATNVTNVMQNKELLQKKYNETNYNLAEEQIELEIRTRMLLQIDEKFKTIYEAKIKTIQNNIKELKLRASILANLIEGR